jgi:hypothetical protein
MANKGSSPGTTTRTEVRKVLRTAAERLSAREEKAVRMRTGSGIDAEAALPRRGTKSVEATAELTALEIELTRKLAERNGATREPEPQVRTRAKDKIIIYIISLK